MNHERKLRAVIRVLGQPKLIKGDEYIFYCPRPEHDGKKKLKLSVNLVTDNFNCWSCGFKGRTLTGILALIRGNPDVAEYNDAPALVTIIEEEFEPAELPKEFQPLVNHDINSKPFFSYLEKRSITPEDIIRYKIGFCTSGKYFGRVIIPSFDANGKLNTFAARSIYKDVKPRYDTPHVDKTNLIFNELMIDWTNDIVLVEGPIDAIVAGGNVVPICGKVLSTRTALFKKLISVKQTVSVALDPDAWEEGIDICVDLSAHGVKTKYVSLFESDPADMGRTKFRERLASATDVGDRLQAIATRVLRMK